MVGLENGETSTRRLILAALAEIQKHKWIESQKRGYDVGGNYAAMDWLDKHYDGWLKTYCREPN
jgi:hypothetical protein